MNGGTFSPGERKVRPGIYFRFTLAADDRITSGSRGTVAVPFKSSWGPVKEVISVASNRDITNKLGLTATDPSLDLYRAAKMNSDKVLLYRVNGGTEATATLGSDGGEEGGGSSGKATAKYPGSRGNGITLVVKQDPVESSSYIVETHMDTRKVDSQVVSNIGELEDNEAVVFSGSGSLESDAGIVLSGGKDEDVATEDVADFLEALEHEHFDALAMIDFLGDKLLNPMYVDFVRTMRESRGVKFQGYGHGIEDRYEGVVNLGNRFILSEESNEDDAILYAVAWAAGAGAGATLRQSNTFKTIPGAVDVSPKYDNDEIISRLQKGEFLFTFDGRDNTVSVEQDINTVDGDSVFKKNKVVRIVDAINNDISRELKQIILGRKSTGEDIPANEDGMQIVRTAVVLYLNSLQDEGIVQNFDSEEDVTIEMTDVDAFYVTIAVQPVDSAEKFYFDVSVN